MADLEKTIQIIFSGEDRLSGTIRSVNSKLGTLETVAQGLANPLAKVADGVLAMDAALAVLVGGGLALAYAKSIQFQSAVVELRKVIGDQPEAIDEARKAALALSNQYGESSADILRSTADFKQAGYEVMDAMSLTKDAMDLVIAGNIEAARSSELLVAILKGFEAPASDAARVIDILNEVSNNYATDVEQLASGMARLSPIANQMGFSLEETAGLLTPVIEIFRSGDEAANALKTGLLKLVDDTAPVQEALNSLGVAQMDANGQLRSGKDILLDVARAFETLDENQKLYIAQQLVGIEQAARMVKVFDGLSKTSEVTATALKSAGSAAQEVAARLASPEVAVKRFATAFENLGIIIGDQFQAAATNAINGATEIELALQEIVSQGTFDHIFDALNTFGNDLEKSLSEIAEALPEAFERVDFSGVLDAMDVFGDEVAAFFGDLDLANPEDLARAIQFAVDSVESLINVTAGMVEAFKPVFEGIKSTIEGFNQLDGESQKAGGNILGAAKLVAEAGLKISSAIIVIGGHADAIERIFSLTINSIMFLWNSAQITFDAVVAGVMHAVDRILAAAEAVTFGGLNESIRQNRAELKAWADAVQENLNRNAFEARENLDGMDRAVGLLGEKAEASGRKITDLGRMIDGIPEEKRVSLEGENIDDLRKELEAMGIDLEKIPDFKKVKMLVNAEGEEDIKKILADIDAIPPENEKQVRITPKVDSDEVERVGNLIIEALPDGKIVIVEARPDNGSLKDAREAIDEEIPTVKRLEIEADIAKEKIKAFADIIRAQLDFKAKVEVAEIEAVTERIQAAFKSVDSTISNTGDMIGDLFGLFSSDMQFSDIYRLEAQIREENRRRDEALQLQRELTEAQIENLNARTRNLQKGAPMITVKGDNLAPHLEAIMWEVLEAIQVRVNEEMGNFLVGL